MEELLRASSHELGKLEGERRAIEMRPRSRGWTPSSCQRCGPAAFETIHGRSKGFAARAMPLLIRHDTEPCFDCVRSFWPRASLASALSSGPHTRRPRLAPLARVAGCSRARVLQFPSSGGLAPCVRPQWSRTSLATSSARRSCRWIRARSPIDPPEVSRIAALAAVRDVSCRSVSPVEHG